MIAYQYNSEGYYVGMGEDYGLLPNNATHITPPALLEGFISRWTGTAWEQVENHVGKEGYVNGEYTIIREYGPLPEGWSDTPPPPTSEELFSNLRMERNRRLSESDYLLLPDYLGVNDEVKLQVVAYRQALRDLPDQEGAPWDGGGPETPWPVMPE